MTGFGTLVGLEASCVNAHLLFSRVWYGKEADGALTDDNAHQLVHLGQVRKAAMAVSADLLRSIHARRRAAVASLAVNRDHVVLHLAITPQWRVVLGHGEDSVHESSLTFSPTYGVPIWPGSALKGVAAAQARAEGRSIDDRVRLFGAPRPEAKDLDAERGGVVVLDALPVPPLKLVVDVLTPHVQPYYNEVNSNGGKVETPPAEYHNPVPVRFLAVTGTTFHTSLVGAPADVKAFHELLAAGVDDLGLGGKTAAGYGYCDIEEFP
ncbi:type III-B CRISPR module RAMP protein Cmr6 [Actinokineospora sp.]|uniref:type III-B CRISPR module RAMP protein Cmr6 n=1 Tax=Actinokineospora sp. TaxID=1872133 RepID=UPI0040382C1B